MNAPNSVIEQPFNNLDPELILSSMEECGFAVTGEMIQLNSFENRVYRIELEPDKNEFPFQRIVAKFYRPGRWPIESILEEHEFLFDLADLGIPAVTPLKLINSKSLMIVEEFPFAVFPFVPGRMPQELSPKDFEEIGHYIAQLHNVGSKKVASNRPLMTTRYYGGWDTLNVLENWVPPHFCDRFFKAAEEGLVYLDKVNDPSSFIRIHGDCHKANLLHNGKQFYFIDFDDFCMGPPIQDLWMLFSDEVAQNEEQTAFLIGYNELRHFDRSSFNIIPGLRILRLLGHLGWIALRWKDPIFPRTFPQFEETSFWSEQTNTLEFLIQKINQ